MSEWTPGDQPNSFVATIRNHLSFLLTVKKRVAILHGDELGVPVFFGDVVVFGELPSPHRTGADVADFPRTNEVVQGTHGLFERCVGIGAMDLEEVDVRGFQTLSRLFSPGRRTDEQDTRTSREFSTALKMAALDSLDWLM